jgi:hypothetical protein
MIQEYSLMFWWLNQQTRHEHQLGLWYQWTDKVTMAHKQSNFNSDLTLSPKQTMLKHLNLNLNKDGQPLILKSSTEKYGPLEQSSFIW